MKSLKERVFKDLYDLVKQYDNYGASDMGTGLLELLYQRTKEGRKIVFRPTSWELYEEPGWEAAAQHLTDEANKINTEFLALMN